MTNLQIQRITFLELLNEAFLLNTGYGTYAHLSTLDGVRLFD